MRLNNIALDDQAITERFVRAAGPGRRQMPRKATAVELRFDIGASSLPDDVKQRLVWIAAKHVSNRGVLMIVSRIHRSQEKNREQARARLAALIRRAADAVPARRVTRPRRVVRQRRASAKIRRAELKDLRRPVRPAAA
jgi:ribosome-associated protein